jgi:hypothetical protein
MKNLLFTFAFLMPFFMFAQLDSVFENGYSGYRFLQSPAPDHGDIGSSAIDMSHQGNNLQVGSNRGATGESSFAVGYRADASAKGATAIGYYSVASGLYSNAIGSFSRALGTNSTALNGGTAYGISSFACGEYSGALGDYSSVFGIGTTSSTYNLLAIGQFNLVGGASYFGSSSSFSLSNPAFVIGNGDVDGMYFVESDAFVVYYNGNATLAGDLNINSDSRLKENIASLLDVGKRLGQLEGKTYSLKSDESKTQRIGLIAQDVQKVFPQLVSESVDGILSVNYQGLVPVLITAFNEQEEKIVKQTERINELERLLSALTSRLESSISTVASN